MQTGENLKQLSGPEKLLGLSRNGPETEWPRVLKALASKQGENLEMKLGHC